MRSSDRKRESQSWEQAALAQNKTFPLLKQQAGS